jgi:hypothetical protein
VTGSLTAISGGSGRGLTTSRWIGLVSVRCAVSGLDARIAAGNIAVDLTDYRRWQIGFDAYGQAGEM